LIRDKQPLEVIEAARKQAMLKKDQAQFQDNAPQPAIDPKFAEIFLRDALKVLETLEAISEKNDYGNEDNMRSYIINVHGIKSALANIGKMDLSAIAMKLEAAGREGKIDMITSETPDFLSLLRAYVEELIPCDETEIVEETDEDKEYLLEKLLAVKSACEEYDENTADEALLELREKTWSQQTSELLGEVAELLLHSDFDEITEAINKFVETL